MASGTGGGGGEGGGGRRSVSPRPPPAPPPSSGSVDLSSFPPFPEPGSVVGPDGRYFCLGKLGRGTFCSIHRCVDLSYCHREGGGGEEERDGGGPKKEGDVEGTKKATKKKKLRIVAAKVELSNFANSGVLDGEATVLRHLSSAMPEGTVPVYLDYVRQSSSGAGVVDPGSALPPGGGGGGGGVSAIIMEYLPGEDMHHLRDRHCQSLPAASSNPSNPPRRVSIPDAVYLTADVMLPLLKEMHDAAVIHRDVKPSNCVRTGTNSIDRSFKMVDFGLSKSFVVPRGSGYADERYPWTKRWQLPPGEAAEAASSSGGCFRKERPDADFRGTSMYASLRVHQGRDYCRRDDVWGLLYVFCDLVSGGLPWMAHAAGRDRNMCRIVKEIVHGERAPGDLSKAGGKDGSSKVEPGTDRIEELLMGADRHLSKHRRESIARATAGTTSTAEGGNKAEGGESDDARLPPLAPALPMASDERKVQLLRDAFGHVSKLGFADEPDYDLVGRCIRGFLEGDGDDGGGGAAHDDVPLIDWDSEPKKRKRRSRNDDGGRVVKREEGDFDGDGEEGGNGNNGPLAGAPYELLSEPDPLHDGRTLDEVEQERQAAILAASDAADLVNVPEAAGGASAEAAGEARLTPEAADLARLPLSLQLRLAQAEYNARHPTTISIHLALRDWMNLALSLVYDPWDTAKYERGNHRTDDDGYRREVREKVLQRCLRAARPFGYFRDPACFYRREEQEKEEDEGGGFVAKKEEESEQGGSARRRGRKRRRISTSAGRLGGGPSSEAGDGGGCSPFLALSKAFFGVKMLVASEKERKFAPPPALSFG